MFIGGFGDFEGWRGLDRSFSGDGGRLRVAGGGVGGTEEGNLVVAPSHPSRWASGCGLRGWGKNGRAARGKQVPRCARNDRQKGKSKSKGKSKGQYGDPSLRSG